jgi:hypothetical protein
VNIGERPQNFIQKTGYFERLEQFPKHKRLIQAKDTLFDSAAHKPFYHSTDLKTFDLSSLGSQFDAILIDPPWDEYAARVKGLPLEHMLEKWTFEELSNLRIDVIGASPSFIFLWAGSHDNI